jgi:hypothetical protein
MSSLRRLIRKILLEGKAKGIHDLDPSVHSIKIETTGPNIVVQLWWRGDDFPAARLTTSRTDNSKVMMVGAMFIDDEKADGFGPLLSDIAMELTTQAGKWLAMDRSSASEDAQKLWQYYRDNRLDVDVTGMQLDSHQNIMTKKKSDNIDSRMADEVMMGWGSPYFSASDQAAYAREFYEKNALMWAFKKQMTVVPELRAIPGLVEEI